MRALLDTSVFVAREQGRPLGELPAEVAVGVVTVAELRHGVLAAADHTTRAVRLRTLEAARRLGSPVVIDEPVANELARLLVELEARGRSLKVMDAWIAATAIVHRAAVCTRDADFDAAQEAGLIDVVCV